MILLALVALFIVVPIAELALIIWVGTEIGVLNTIALLILDSVLGSLLMRSQGRHAWRRFNQALMQGRPPAKEVIDGVLVIGGGALLLTPGFISDVFGLLLLLPPTRAIVRRLILWRTGGPMLVGFAETVGRDREGERRRGRRGRGGRPPGAGPGSWNPPEGAGSATPRRDYDVEGTATEIDP